MKKKLRRLRLLILAIVVGVFFMPAALANNSLKPALEFSLAPELHHFVVDEFPSSQMGMALHIGFYMPLRAELDFGVRGRVFSMFSDLTGKGASFDFLARYFPFTFSRMPEFTAGPNYFETIYKWMPYIASGIGINFQAADDKDLSKILGVMGRFPVYIGAYVPININLALDFALQFGYGQTLTPSAPGNPKLKEFWGGFNAGIALLP